MTLYYAKVKNGTNTIKMGGETLCMSNPSAFAVLTQYLAEKCNVTINMNDYDICSIKVCALHEPMYVIEKPETDIFDSNND